MMDIPRRRSRNWGRCAILIDVMGFDVDVHLQRRDDPARAVVVRIPAAWIADPDVALWPRVLARANRVWRRTPGAATAGSV